MAIIEVNKDNFEEEVLKSDQWDLYQKKKF